MSSKGMIVGGAGSSPINFKVVGSDNEPASPRENTIWVNTEQEITSWVISTQEPETPGEGMVWIKAGNKSTLLMNLLRKNNISLYPIAVKQYLAGEWVSKETHVYTQGKWVLITADIYFVKDGVLTNETSTMKTVSFNGRVPASEQREDGYYIGMPAWDGGTWTRGAMWFPNPVDLTNYKLVSAVVQVLDDLGTDRIFVSKNEPTSSGTNAVASVTFASSAAGNFAPSVDVSALTGPHYIGFHFDRGSTALLKEVVIVGND